jgi:integrase
MSVRKRAWKTSTGIEKTAWIVVYVDQNGKRRAKQFSLQRDAKAFALAVSNEIREGVHTPERDTVTVAAAGQQWLDSCEQRGLERTTRDSYRQALELHIKPFLGRRKLSTLSVPVIRKFEDALRAGEAAPGEQTGKVRSPALVRHIRVALGALVADAQERGLCARNPVKEMNARRKSGHESRSEARHKPHIGQEIPSMDEIGRIISALEQVPTRYRTMLLTAIFCGLRASELRGLDWQNIDFKKRQLHVVQRADRYSQIGSPKTKAGNRTIPLGDRLLNTLREWKVASGGKDGQLVFGTRKGKPDGHSNILVRAFHPVQVTAGVVDSEGGPKYTGLHSLRHFFASMCINRKVDGGLELPAKVVQERLGHSSIAMTLDVYSHLFPRGDDLSELAAAEAALWAGP